jgi:hypothetical protein
MYVQAGIVGSATVMTAAQSIADPAVTSGTSKQPAGQASVSSVVALKSQIGTIGAT